MPGDASPRPAPRRILAVGAHPDDVELGRGGIVAEEVASGLEVSLPTLPRGEAGSSGRRF